MPQRHPRIAFWLMPEPDVCRRLQPVIDSLAKRFDAPRFTPHVTLSTCQRSPTGAELLPLIHLAQRSRPLTLSADGLVTGSRLAQTLFIRLQPHALLNALCQALDAGTGQSSTYRLDPHLSLLYQDLPQGIRTKLIAELPLPVTRLRCDSLQAVAIPERLDAPAAFNGWQTLLSVRLAG